MIQVRTCWKGWVQLNEIFMDFFFEAVKIKIWGEFDQPFTYSILFKCTSRCTARLNKPEIISNSKRREQSVNVFTRNWCDGLALSDLASLTAPLEHFVPINIGSSFCVSVRMCERKQQRARHPWSGSDFFICGDNDTGSRIESPSCAVFFYLTKEYPLSWLKARSRLTCTLLFVNSLFVSLRLDAMILRPCVQVGLV